MKIDIVADTSGATRALDAIKSNPGLRARVGRITYSRDTAIMSQSVATAGIDLIVCALPAEAFATAIAGAATDQRHLLVLMGGVAPTVEEIDCLVAIFAADAMIGYVIPRFADAATGRVLALPSSQVSQSPVAYDARILEHLPPLQVAPEFLAACVLVNARLVANFPDVDRRFATMTAALRAAMTWGRRVGFRTAIANHIVIACPARGTPYPELNSEDRQLLIEYFPDFLLADARFRELACHRRETLLGGAISSTPSQRQRLLFDCSGMPPFFNGTSECMLGILDGFAASASDWTIDVLAPEDAATFHGLNRRYDRFGIITGKLEHTYTVAVRLSQPWTLQAIAQLHEHALYVVVHFLDTIAWDIIYPSTPEVERAWAFAAAHVDGIIYDSAFTRDRFKFRFQVASHVHERLTYLSCHYDEYRFSPATPRQDLGHILLVGNDFKHKGMAQALHVLAETFPDEQFVAVGYDVTAYGNVKSVSSGRIPTAELERLFAQARMLVYPSFYEGFGLPVVKGLAYELDVVARRSDLLCEIAAICAPSGRIVPFDDPPTLVGAVRALLSGDTVETIPLGTALGGSEPLRWRDVAARILHLVNEMTARPSGTVHDRRETALRTVWPTGSPEASPSRENDTF